MGVYSAIENPNRETCCACLNLKCGVTTLAVLQAIGAVFSLCIGVLVLASAAMVSSAGNGGISGSVDTSAMGGMGGFGGSVSVSTSGSGVGFMFYLSLLLTVAFLGVNVYAGYLCLAFLCGDTPERRNGVALAMLLVILS